MPTVNNKVEQCDLGPILDARRKGVARKKATRTPFDDATIATLMQKLVDRELPGTTKLQISDDQVKGLSVLIRYTGRAIFIVMYRVGDSRRQMNIGEHPAMNVEKARAAAKTLLVSKRKER